MGAGKGLKPFLCVALTGILARGAMTMLWPPPGGLVRLEPSVIAANLQAGRGFVFEQYGALYHAWKEPLYIVLLALLTGWAGDSRMVLLLFQGLFGVATALGVTVIAYRLLGDSVRATMAGVIAAGNPFLVYYDTHFIHPLSLDALCFVVSIGTILLAVDQRGARWSRALLAGVVTGVALWQRATLLAMGIASWVVAVGRGASGERRLMARLAALWLFVVLAIVSPWMARNYVLFSRPVLTTDFAHIFWLGNNPWSNGTYSDMRGERVFWRADPEFRARIHGAVEIAQYDMFLDAAWTFISTQPESYARLTLRRLAAFVWFSPNAGVGYTMAENVLYRGAYTVLLGFGALGFLMYWRRADASGRYRAMVVSASVVGLAAVHTLTAINLKHRVPLELVLAVFAAEGVCGAMRRTART